MLLDERVLVGPPMLVTAGLNPVIVVLQGWVPRGGEGELIKRSRIALNASLVFAVAFCVVFVPTAPYLMSWLSDGQIHVPMSMVILTALVTGIAIFWGAIENAVLSAFDRLDIVSRASAVSLVAMPPLVIVGTVYFGAVGALTGVIIGLVVRMAIDLAGAHRIARDRRYLNILQ